MLESIDWSGILTPAVSAIAVAIFAALSKVVVSYINKSRDLVITKIGAERYNRAREFAKGLFILLEDEFKDVSDAGNKKKDEMQKKLLEKFPDLTQDELDAINKEIWNGFRLAGTILDQPATDEPAEDINTSEEEVNDDSNGTEESSDNLDDGSEKSEYNPVDSDDGFIG